MSKKNPDFPSRRVWATIREYEFERLTLLAEAEDFSMPVMTRRTIRYGLMMEALLRDPDASITVRGLLPAAEKKFNAFLREDFH